MTDKLEKVRGKWREILEYHGVFDIEDELLNTPITIEGGVCPECLGAKMLWDSLSHSMDYPCPTCKGTGKLDKTITIREAIERMME